MEQKTTYQIKPHRQIAYVIIKRTHPTFGKITTRYNGRNALLIALADELDIDLETLINAILKLAKDKQ